MPPQVNGTSFFAIWRIMPVIPYGMSCQSELFWSLVIRAVKRGLLDSRRPIQRTALLVRKTSCYTLPEDNQ